MTKKAPLHIKAFCTVDNEDETYKKLVAEYEDNNHFVYKAQCSCSNTTFRVYTDEHPTVLIRCIKCNKEITVYDLQYYPAAVKLDDEAKMKQISFQQNSAFYVYPIYEYGDFDEDMGFDENDISWCVVFIRDVKESTLIKIIDDETA